MRNNNAAIIYVLWPIYAKLFLTTLLTIAILNYRLNFLGPVAHLRQAKQLQMMRLITEVSLWQLANPSNPPHQFW